MGGANNGERLTAIEAALARIADQLGTPGGSAGDQNVLLYDATGKPLTAESAGVTVVQVPKQAAAAGGPSIDWTKIVTALLALAGVALPAMLKRPDPMEQMAAMMQMFTELQESKSETAETIAALTPLVMMMKGGAAPAGANGNGGGADDQIQAAVRAFVAAQAAGNG